MNNISIVDSEGNKKSVNLLTTIYLQKYNSSYIAYMEDELSDKNVISFAKMKEENGEMYLDNITSMEELEDLKKEFGKELYK